MRKLLLLVFVFGIVLSSVYADEIFIDQIGKKTPSIFDILFGNNYAIYVSQNRDVAQGTNLRVHYEDSVTEPCSLSAVEGVVINVYRIGNLGSSIGGVVFNTISYGTPKISQTITAGQGLRSFPASMTVGPNYYMDYEISTSSLSEGNYVVVSYWTCNGKAISLGRPVDGKAGFGTWTDFNVVSNTCQGDGGQKCFGLGAIYNIDKCGNRLGSPVSYCPNGYECNSANTGCAQSLKSCSNWNGDICASNEQCWSGYFTKTTDSARCCVGGGCELISDTGTGGECPSTIDPVCASNGATYLNQCLLDKSGFSFVNKGACNFTQEGTKQISLTEEEYNAATPRLILASSCNFGSECSSREGYEIKCLINVDTASKNKKAFDDEKNWFCGGLVSEDFSLPGIFKYFVKYSVGPLINVFCDRNEPPEGTCRAELIGEDTLDFAKFFSWAPRLGLSSNPKTDQTLSGMLIILVGLFAVGWVLKKS